MPRGAVKSTIYKLSNGHHYKTDEVGRIMEVKGNLKLDPNDRNAYQQLIAGGSCRKESDCGGHLIAAMFGGAGEGINLVAMDKTLNGVSGKWYKMEQRWAKAIKEGKSVEVNIKPIYQGNSQRSDEFNISYIIGKDKQQLKMRNTPTGD